MQKEIERSLGVLPEPTPEAYGSRQQRLRRYINLRLIAAGFHPVPLDNATADSTDAEELSEAFRERVRCWTIPAARPIGGSTHSCTSIFPAWRASRGRGCRSGR